MSNDTNTDDQIKSCQFFDFEDSIRENLSMNAKIITDCSSPRTVTILPKQILKNIKDNKRLDNMTSEKIQNLISFYQQYPQPSKNNYNKVNKLHPSKYKLFERVCPENKRIKGLYNQNKFNKIFFDKEDNDENNYHTRSPAIKQTKDKKNDNLLFDDSTLFEKLELIKIISNDSTLLNDFIKLHSSIHKYVVKYNDINNVKVSQCEFTLNGTKNNKGNNYKEDFSHENILLKEEVNYDDCEEIDEYSNTDKYVSKRTHMEDKKVEVLLNKNCLKRDDNFYNENFEEMEEIRVGERIHRIETACEGYFKQDLKQDL